MESADLKQNNKHGIRKQIKCSSRANYLFLTYIFRGAIEVSWIIYNLAQLFLDKAQVNQIERILTLVQTWNRNDLFKLESINLN